MKKLLLAVRGDVDNPKLWSGTPTRMLSLFRENNVDVTSYDWNMRHFLRSAYAFFGRKFFTWGGAADPLMHCFATKKARTMLRYAEEHGFDTVFFTPDCCMPKNYSQAVKTACYTDAVLADIFPYIENKKWWSKVFMRRYERNIQNDYENLTYLFTQNEWSRQSVIRRYGIDSKKVFNVGFGVNLKPLEEEKNYDNDLLLIVLRKGTERYKGLYLLLEAFKRVRAVLPKVRLAVVGTEEQEHIDGVEYYYNQPRETTVRLFREATLYTMPALREPNGMTYLEALANKTPIVGLNRFAVPEFSGDGQWGFVCAEESAEAVASTIIDALSDKERLCEMGKRGQEFVMRNYNWTTVVEKILKILKQE